MNNPIVYDYKGSQISFINGDSVMINATQMAKSFGKRVPEWTRLQSTKDFLDNLWTVRKNLDPVVQKMHYDIEQVDDKGLNHILKSFDRDLHLIVTTNGGQIQGTWMHEDVALEFARWLSPAFAIWCNDKIKELLKTGVTTVSNDDEAIAYAMQVLNKRLEQARQEKAMLEQQNNYLANEIKLVAPKVQYYDNTLQSVNTLTTTQIAKQIGTDAGKLHRKLKEAGILFRQSGQWMLRSPYSAWGLHATRTQTYTRSDGSIGTSTYTVWTEKGRRFIITLHRNGYSARQAVREIKEEQKR